MFAESGASVVLADIDGDLAAKEAERIVLEGGTAIGVACDVADEAQVAAMVDRAVAEYGRLDMAFNNAGIQVPPSDAADEPIEHFERVTAVNQRGVWACMKHELRVMRDQGQRRDRQLFVPGRSRRPPATRSLSRHQACRARHDQERGCRICAARHPHQRRMPGRHRARQWSPICSRGQADARSSV